MTLSFWIISLLIVGICVFVFTKTVSNDVKNDFKLRDILSKAGDDDIFSKPKTYQVDREEEKVTAGYTKPEQETEYAYSKNYSTESYSTMTHEVEEDNVQDSDGIFYEKIDDEACENYKPYEQDDYTDTQEDKSEDCDDNYSNQKSERDFSKESAQEFTSEFTPDRKPKKGVNLFYFVKTFWRGITFSVGLLVTLYSFMGLATQVQTSNDAIVYSIWLLIGVILVK